MKLKQVLKYSLHLRDGKSHIVLNVGFFGLSFIFFFIGLKLQPLPAIAMSLLIPSAWLLYALKTAWKDYPSDLPKLRVGDKPMFTFYNGPAVVQIIELGYKKGEWRYNAKVVEESGVSPESKSYLQRNFFEWEAFTVDEGQQFNNALKDLLQE